MRLKCAIHRVKNQTLWPLLAVFMGLHGLAHATSSPEAVPSVAAPSGQTGTQEPSSQSSAPATPFPRRIPFPQLYAFWAKEMKGGRKGAVEPRMIKFNESRFTIVSFEVTEPFVPLINELNRRSIRIVALYPEETDATFQNAISKAQHPFLMGRVAPRSVAETRGLEIPSAWVVNNRGEVLGRWANLSTSETKEILQKVLLWSDF
jgi:hypothetical protein